MRPIAQRPCAVRWLGLGVGSGLPAWRWFVGSLPPGISDLTQPFVYGGVALSVIAITVAYLTMAWHLIKNRRRVTAGRLVEALVVAGVPVALLWLALALTGVPNNATELRLQRAIGIGKCNLASQDLSGYRLAGVGLTGCDLFRVDLSGADLTDAFLSSANLGSANLSGATLRGADLVKANLTGADLSGADLGAAYLAYSSLRGADLTEADLSEAMLDFAILSEAKLDETTKIADKWRLVWEIVTHGGSNRDLAGADLSWADLRRVDFSGANLAGANLSSSRLNGADLTGADLGSADLRGTIVSDVQLGQAGTLTGATMSDGSTHE